MKQSVFSQDQGMVTRPLAEDWTHVVKGDPRKTKKSNPILK